MSDSKHCPLGEDCDLTIAYMLGAERAKDTIKAQADEIERLRAALEFAAKELELLYFFAISNGIAEAGVPPHVAARAALEGK